MGPIASLFGVGDVSTPSAGSIGNQTLQMIKQLAGVQPTSVATQGTYGPQYEGITLDEIYNAIGGANGLGSDFLSGLESLIPGINFANAGQAAGTTGTVAGMGGAAGSAVGSINPAETSALSSLLDTTQSQLKAGTTLDPATATNITNQVDANWASRGLGASNPAELDLATQLATAGQNTLAQRESAAGSAISQAQQDITNPALSILTTPSNAPALSANLTNTAGSIAGPSGPSLTDPMSVMNALFNAQSAANIQSANNQAGLMSY